ncbi:elongation of very long chain fatty acids 4 [Brachionus plicatilis]|uniref:Elongation of very long chain fatty acids protein n=1 Tax=Brachionus plicatilis TaxID=10195 RepID=A0A3M7RDL3_BRAPC|nr:elongation of very long chain fatty acids 4 [Brachionus plicatilis]
MESIVDTYEYYMSRGDDRVKNWLGMETPWLTLAILALYILSINGIKKYMSDRKPFELRIFMIVYNFIQVIASFYIFAEVAIVAIKSKYSMTCEPVNYSNNRLAVRMASVLHFYYLMKLVDLIDTVIFALRKKSNQISFLHVFHHSSMVINSWCGVKWVAGGQTFFLCCLNSLVHSIMYGYYGLSACGPSIQKYLWWKKYLTQVQLVQFFVIMTHAVVNIFQKNCAYQKGYSIAFVFYGVFITSLFLNFYKKSYSNPKNKLK